ncbi:aromatic hydrocarbon degradation protein [Marinobacter salinexigens]|uniref:Aromatic hydrocarbon degradation protein n=1 Tax=Marinobacter salinexigens TaxID=2919747 RepID=A0A5B0V837_9GAMM|nr:outer membrane protein transport protein [Marinobacter salinexigens]KAA1170717.1 aromatic hydrocarbon degradation protein [Marinobacter salinexigens]
MVSTSRFRIRTLSRSVAAATFLASATVSANMGNIGTTYGLLPTDIASAQALSMFNTQVSATYYNPAYLAKDPRGELTGGFLHGAHELRAEGADRTGSIVSDRPSQNVLIGMKTNLSSLTRVKHPIYLGFVAGVEKLGKELLAFNSETSNSGQFLTYERQPLFLNLGGATTLWRGIDAGFATRITLHSEASLSATTDLAGNTQYESLSVNAKPSIRTILSTSIDLGETLCPDSDCFLDGFETAFVYRSSSNTRTTVEANTVIPGLIPASDPLQFAISTYDSYQPTVYAVGLQYSASDWRVGLTLEQQNWSDLEDEFAGDDIKDQAAAQFDDILIPRIGGEMKLGDTFGVTAGLAFQPTALKSTSTQDVNYFDNDKYIVGLGLSAEYKRTRILAYPVRLDLGYQYQMLQERDFTISTTDPDASNNGTVVSTDGDVHVFSGSVTLKF